MNEILELVSKHQLIRIDWITPIWFQHLPSMIHDELTDLSPEDLSTLIFGDKSQADALEDIRSFELTEILMDKHEGGFLFHLTTPVIKSNNSFSWGHTTSTIILAKDFDDAKAKIYAWYKEREDYYAARVKKELRDANI